MNIKDIMNVPAEERYEKFAQQYETNSIIFIAPDCSSWECYCHARRGSPSAALPRHQRH